MAKDNACLKVLRALPRAAAKRALKHKRFYHGAAWANNGVS